MQPATGGTIRDGIGGLSDKKNVHTEKIVICFCTVQ